MRRQNIYRVMLVAFILMFSAAAEASDITLKVDVATIKTSETQQLTLAKEWATKNNYPVRIKVQENGIGELVGILDERPIYLQTLNIGAAHTTRADQLWPNGAVGIQLTGSSMTKVAVWDGGTVFDQHQEFKLGSISRVTLQDNTSHIHHATHVAGTIMAAGKVSDARGAAYETRMDSYDWSSDLSEMFDAAEKGLLLSNHSYGIVAGWSYGNYSGNYGWHWLGDSRISETEDYIFGYYDSTPRSWDQLMSQYPNYLVVQAAGNDRNTNGPGPGGHHYYADYAAGMWRSSTTTRDADGGSSGYDTLLPRGVSKNGLTVGAVSEVQDYNGSNSVQLASFSGCGPTDDGRIKPDIVAKGVSTYSTTYSSSYPNDTARYTTSSGTSMATPSVTGALVLLREYYQQLTSKTMRSATLKALVIHTADEAGANPGPDYQYGWGLINAEKAAELLKTDAHSMNVMEELTLNQGGQYTRSITASGQEPLIVTIAWTDPMGPRPSMMVDPATRILVNDLDIHLKDSDGTIYYPWTLNPSYPSGAAKQNQENNIDNIEQVYIAAPNNSNYEIIVNHDGTLLNSMQNFSIVISGITDAAPAPTPVANGPHYPQIDELISEYNIELQWQSVENATEYRLYIGTDNPPTNVVNGQATSDTTWNLSLQDNQNYYWQAVPVVDDTEMPADDYWTFRTIEIVTAIPYSEDLESLTTLPDGWSVDGSSGGDWFILNDNNFTLSAALVFGDCENFGCAPLTEKIDKTVYLRPIYLDAEYGYQFRMDYQAAHASSQDQFDIGIVTTQSLDSVLTVASFASNGNTATQVATMDFYPPESGTYYFYVRDVSEANAGYGLITDNFQVKRYTSGIPQNLAVQRVGYNKVYLNAIAVDQQSLQVEFTNLITGKVDTVLSANIPAKIKRMKPQTEYSVRARFNFNGTHISSRWTPEMTVYTDKTPPGHCVLFNGENEYFSFTPQENIYSIEVWLYSNANNQVIGKLGEDVIEIQNGHLLSSRTNSVFINGTPTTALPKNAWAHVAINFNTPISSELIEIGRSDNNFFMGKMDELLLYTAARSQTQIHESMCRLPFENEPDLHLRYHFEESLFEMISNNSILEGMGDGSIMQTFAANSRESSTIPVGETGVFIQTTEPQTIGAEGSEMTVTALTEGDSANYLQAFVIGEGDVWVTEEATYRVADILWGVNRTGSLRADLLFNYSGFDVITNEDNLRLLRRLDKDSPWYDVSDQAEWNTTEDQILITNTTSFGEYALGEGDYQTLDIDLTAFFANRKDSVVTIAWQLVGSQTAAFTLYRQYNGQSMEKVKDIPVTELIMQNSYTATDYIATAETPNYYIKEISITGKSKMHGPFEVSLTSGVADAVHLPTTYSMKQNYPNPFNSSTIIEYSLKQDSPTTMQVYDVLGRLVETLVNENQRAGRYKINWQVSAIPTGVYWVVLNSNAGTLRQKVLYVR